MVKISEATDKENVVQRLYSGDISAVQLSESSLVDDAIMAMKHHGFLDCLGAGFPDKRASNSSIQIDAILALSTAAKMKICTSLTDIPFALNDHRTICEIGYSMWDTKRDLNTGLMSEGTLRRMIDKYSADELISIYNNAVQNHIMPKLDVDPNLFTIDTTVIGVNLKNENYENSGLVYNKQKNKKIRGYKLSTIRGIVNDSGIIQDIKFDNIQSSDINFCREMLLTTPVLKPGSSIINDRGFLDRDLINDLKIKREVDTYVPLRKGMNAREIAVQIAKEENKWRNHPNKKRPNQMIAFVSNLGPYWHSNKSKYSRIEDVPLNGCVVWDTITDEYFVFVTTDLTKTARQIIKTYELRPEIEEEYRQIKDFWKIEDFTSTKFHMITFHVICVLLGYLFYRLFTFLPEGEKWAGKCLPLATRKYVPKVSAYVVVYVNKWFAIFTILEMMKIYSECDKNTQLELDKILKFL